MSTPYFAVHTTVPASLTRVRPQPIMPRCWIQEHGDQTDFWLATDLSYRCERAIETLYNRHAFAVTRLARRVTGEARYAEEVTQEVFATLWRAPEKYDSDRGTLRNWLLTLTHRRSVDLVRIERRLVATAPDPVFTELFSPDVPVDVQVSDAIAAEHARTALCALPTKLRDVLVLAYFDGYTQAEIAEALSLPLGTVKTRTRSALRSLATTLRDADRLIAV